MAQRKTQTRSAASADATGPDGDAAETEATAAGAPDAQELTPAEDAAPAGTEGADTAALDARDGEIAKLRDQLLRALAEVENTRRRAERDREDAAKYGIATLAREFLDVADNLRRALDSVDAAAETEALKALTEGVAMTERALLAIFERHGIRKIVPMGEKFDYNFHQAMFEIEDESHPPGTVVQVVQPGYVLHERLLRPAMVGIAKARGGAQPQGVDTSA